jgi:hypothetical protein
MKIGTVLALAGAAVAAGLVVKFRPQWLGIGVAPTPQPSPKVTTAPTPAASPLAKAPPIPAIPSASKPAHAAPTAKADPITAAASPFLPAGFNPPPGAPMPTQQDAGSGDGIFEPLADPE